MARIFSARVSICTLLLLTSGLSHAGDPTVGWFGSEAGVSDGYTLFAPMRSTTTYLLDNHGREVHSWSSSANPGNSVYLLESGILLRTAKVSPTPPINAGGWGGRIQMLDWDGTPLWDYTYSSSQVQHHHDVAYLPNGNVLLLAWEVKTPAEAIQAGRDPSTAAFGIWPDHVIEVQPTFPVGGNIVWEWHAWDHMIQDFDPTKDNYGVVGDHPELLDLNFGPPDMDWTHCNAIDYNAELDQILISSPDFSEIWIIDHSTDTAEAAGHTGGNLGMGGDIVYRWGNPQAYDAGTAAYRTLFGQHDVEWIRPGLPGAGNILMFNNGSGRPGGNYTSIDEITPPVQPDGSYPLAPGAAHGPDDLAWTYFADPPESFYANFISGSQRLPNGNTLICHGPQGTFFEITEPGDEIWRYLNPVIAAGPIQQGDSFPPAPAGNNWTFRADRYPVAYPGLAGRDLTPVGPIELLPPPGDFDDDGDVDEEDAACFLAAFTGSCGAPPCEPPLLLDAIGYVADLDGDGDVDCDDGAELANLWTEPGSPTLPAECGRAAMIRGDANADGSLGLADAIVVLQVLFQSFPTSCESALDIDDDDVLGLADAIGLLQNLFGDGDPPAAPFPGCGLDPTPGALGCASFPACP